MFLYLPAAVPEFVWPIHCAVTPIQKDVITYLWMGVTAHGWVKQIPELLPEDIGTFLGKIKVISIISGHSSTFPDVFIV
jgi:hypothetical protein